MMKGYTCRAAKMSGFRAMREVVLTGPVGPEILPLRGTCHVGHGSAGEVEGYQRRQQVLPDTPISRLARQPLPADEGQADQRTGPDQRPFRTGCPAPKSQSGFVSGGVVQSMTAVGPACLPDPWVLHRAGRVSPGHAREAVGGLVTASAQFRAGPLHD